MPNYSASDANVRDQFFLILSFGSSIYVLDLGKLNQELPLSRDPILLVLFLGLWLVGNKGSWENNPAISFVLMKVWYSPAIKLLDRSQVFPITIKIDSSTSEVEHSRFLRRKEHAFTLLPLID
ncbi:hypothetical protein Bca101_043532 [Brassica carinata]